MFSSIFFVENLGITICWKNTDRAQFGWYSDIQNTSILSAQLYSGDAANIYDGIFNLKVFCEKKSGDQKFLLEWNWCWSSRWKEFEENCFFSNKLTWPAELPWVHSCVFWRHRFTERGWEATSLELWWWWWWWWWCWSQRVRSYVIRNHSRPFVISRHVLA